MSLDSLLDSLLAVPHVPLEESYGEPRKVAKNKAGSPGSPSSPEKSSFLDETLTTVCRDLSITPAEVHDALDPEDIEDWSNGDFSDGAITAFARALVQRREMEQGKRPAHYTQASTCLRCGSVWLWEGAPEQVQGCPWCFNRLSGLSVPSKHKPNKDA